MVSEVWYTNNGSRYLAYRYKYRADGQLHSAENVTSGKISLYQYDLKGRLTGTVEYDTTDYYNKYSARTEYDVFDRITNKSNRFDYALTNSGVDSESVTTYYRYSDNGDLTGGIIASDVGNTNVSYSYNSFKQLTGVIYDRASFDQSISLDYLIKNGNRSALVSSFISTSGGIATSYSYTYDNYGNITSITSGGQTVQYQYDGLKRLTLEDNPYLGTSTRYYYAENGNISQKSVTYSLSGSSRTYSYTYGNSDFGDQLTAYDGNPITYDALGNPLSYYNGSNYTFTWTGRELTTAKKGGGNVISYEYNASGMRTSKTVGGAKTLYFYDGDRLVGEMNGTNITVYLYSPDGGIVGMQVRSLSSSSSGWSTYWYEKNLQGDIVAIYDNSGNKQVTYAYDAWGNHTVTYSNNGASIVPVANNPLRYRGYYYDADLSLYYLQTRYYDSFSGRFISPDAPENLGSDQNLISYNLYAYCSNNPVMYTDPTGESWLGAIIGAALNVVTTFLSAVITNQEYTWIDATFAAASGAIAGGTADAKFLTGIVAGILFSGAFSGIGAFVSTAIGDSPEVAVAAGIVTAAFSIFTISSIIAVHKITLGTGTSTIVGLTFGLGSNAMAASVVKGLKR